jgi:hypothetical protein
MARLTIHIALKLGDPNVSFDKVVEPATGDRINQ